MQISTISAAKRAPLQATTRPKEGFTEALLAEKGSTRTPAEGRQVQGERAMGPSVEPPRSQNTAVAPGKRGQKIHGMCRSARHLKPKVAVGLPRRKMKGTRASIKTVAVSKKGFVAQKITVPRKSAGSSSVFRRTWRRPRALGGERRIAQPKGFARMVKPTVTTVKKANAVKSVASAGRRMRRSQGSTLVPRTDAVRKSAPSPTKRSLKSPGKALFAAGARTAQVATGLAKGAKFRLKDQNSPRAEKPKPRLGFAQARIVPLTLPKPANRGRVVPAGLGTPIASKEGLSSSENKLAMSEPVVSATSRALPSSLTADLSVLAQPASPTRIPPKAPARVEPQPLPESNAATTASPLLPKGPAWTVVQASATEDGQTTTWAVRPPPRDRARPFLLEVAKNGAAVGTIKTTVRLKGLQSAAALGFATVDDVRQLARELAQRVGQTTVQVQVSGNPSAMQAQAGFHGSRQGSEGAFRLGGSTGGKKREEILLAAGAGDGIDFRA